MTALMMNGGDGSVNEAAGKLPGLPWFYQLLQATFLLAFY
jgi:hypothetical protein